MRAYRTTNALGQDVLIQFQYGSTNSKTGTGVQIWILPYRWITEGKSAMEDDEASCMDCPQQESKSDLLCEER